MDDQHDPQQQQHEIKEFTNLPQTSSCTPFKPSLSISSTDSLQSSTDLYTTKDMPDEPEMMECYEDMQAKVTSSILKSVSR